MFIMDSYCELFLNLTILEMVFPVHFQSASFSLYFSANPTTVITIATLINLSHGNSLYPFL